MSRHSQGSATIGANIRLKIAGWWWIAVSRVQIHAEQNYKTAYFKKHGRPTLLEVLDGDL